MGIILLVAGLVLIFLSMWLLRRRRWIARIAGGMLLLLAFAALLAGGYWTWFTHRRQPPPLQAQWFQGVAYERIVRQAPRHVVMHLVRVNLQTEGTELVFTPVSAAGDRPLAAATVSQFAANSGSQVAINANFFFPFSAGSPLSYYPHSHEPVQVAGIAAYQGLIYQSHPFAPPFDPAATLYVSRDGTPSFSFPADGLWNAVSGSGFLLRDGKPVATPEDVDAIGPRTAVGLDASGHTLFLAVVDGKQPSYSLGVTLPEFSQLLADAGVHTAINLDGGGSSTLVRDSDSAHAPELISSPSNFRFPWWERPVANQLGIKARLIRQ